MLNKIRSIYFIRVILSHLEENVKLDLIKYNKDFKNKLKIDIENYITFNNRYIMKQKELEKNLIIMEI